ncbi:MAG: HAD family acid phosphatase [Alphaproteobacteria bacterium]
MTHQYSARRTIAGFSLILAAGLTACSTMAPAPAVTLKSGTEWVANAPGWGEEAADVFKQASKYVETVSGARAEHSWAVVLDLDETVMNNVAYQVSRETQGEGYTSESWYNWTQLEQATLVPGAKDFINIVNRLGGHVVFVTNRRDSEQLATETNLKALGLERGKDFRVLLTRAAPLGKSDKSIRFNLVPALLAAQGYMDVETVAYVGDNKGDKPEAGSGWLFFCIDQGGMYGDPCAAIVGPGQ